MREYVRNTFLSPNEIDKLKLEIEYKRNASHDSVAIFIRNFRELAIRADPASRTADAEQNSCTRVF